MYFDLTVAPCLLFEMECLQTKEKSLNYTITGFITYCIGQIMLTILAKGLATGFSNSLFNEDVC